MMGIQPYTDSKYPVLEYGPDRKIFVEFAPVHVHRDHSVYKKKTNNRLIGLKTAPPVLSIDFREFHKILCCSPTMVRAGMRLANCKKWLDEKGTDTRKKKK